jgi:hypothetical protein
MPRDFVLALDEIWVKDADGKGRTVAVQATTPQELEQIVLAASASSGAETQAVMYEDGAERNDFTRRLVTPLVTVKLADQTDAASVAGLAQASSFDLPDYAPGYAVLRTGGGLAALRAVDLLSGAAGVELVEPQLARLHTKKAMPNDPLINQQWHHKFNSQAGAVAGTDLNIETAWAYPTGAGGASASASSTTDCRPPIPTFLRMWTRPTTRIGTGMMPTPIPAAAMIMARLARGTPRPAETTVWGFPGLRPRRRWWACG